ncbi:hypothetical protein QEZ54_24605 [Catellatospora sp. KI3]|uniref:hypothetical protein n=1 Tax=Catellatospora sp. KI3 TaxID=3041620 RepID=UPI00248255ED|nr:hypothetical protein [Catellatospora sp. KI3]MDI1464164.1 hypothetical protein [Catellatospora sp. KI3]
MTITSAHRRVLAGLVAAAAATAGLTLAAAAPAQASTYYESAPTLSWRYTDSRDGATSFDATSDVPLGAWRDENGKHHMSRSYVTFDLTPFAGEHRKLYSAHLFISEKSVNECGKRAIEIWTTSGSPAEPTWRSPRSEVSRIAEETDTRFCPGLLDEDLTTAVRDALAQGSTQLSIELRVPEAYEGDVTYGRKLKWSYGMRLTVGSNTPPTVDGNKLFSGALPCADQGSETLLPGSGQKPLWALVRDADANDDSRLSAEWAMWPVDHPEQRTVLTGYARNGLGTSIMTPQGFTAHGGHYAWQVRALDGTDTSEWSRTCYFTVDAQAPANAPGVSSPQFPPNPQEWTPGGTPGVFTFTASGATDVAGYQYSWSSGLNVIGVYSIGPDGLPVWKDPFDGPGMVRAGADGTATVTLSPPRQLNTLYVRTVDRAGNAGPTTQYDVRVTDTAPTLSVNGATSWGYYEVGYGEDVHVHATPHAGLTGVVEYGYSFNGGDPQYVTAAADGSADFTVALPAQAGSSNLDVWTVSANGWVSPRTNAYLVLVTGPKVTSDVYPNDPEGDPLGGAGVTGTFTFEPRLPNVEEYLYSFDWAEAGSVAADADGKATITWTPAESGFHAITVVSRSADGTYSDPTEYYIYVA